MHIYKEYHPLQLKTYDIFLSFMIPTLILTLLFFYLGVGWALPLELISPLLSRMGILLLILFYSTKIWFFFVYIRAKEDETVRHEHFLKNATYVAMGFASLLFTFMLMRDVLALCLLPFESSPPLHTGEVSLFIFCISLILYLLGSFNASFKLKVTQPRIRCSENSRALTKMTVVQVSDIHFGGGPKLNQIRRIFHRLESIKPDLLLLTGDIIDGDIRLIQNELDLLRSIQPRFGKIAVLGNHECYWNPKKCAEALISTGTELLINSGRVLNVDGHQLYIAGVTDPTHAHFGGPAPEVPTPPSDVDYKILLAHQPKLSKLKNAELYDLQLSGHTHAGQFFPWNLMVRLIYPESWGLHEKNKPLLYINSGTGFWGPKLRLGTECEITQFHFSAD